MHFKFWDMYDIPSQIWGVICPLRDYVDPNDTRVQIQRVRNAF
jgi:hypothetical protein